MVTQVQWWCSAQGTRWSWKWRAYPGIWLVVLGIAAGYWALTRRGPRTPQALRRRWIGWVGVAIVWLALDWPVGPLAAGYLASAHAVQFLVLTMVASPLILLGLEPALAFELSQDHLVGPPDDVGDDGQTSAVRHAENLVPRWGRMVLEVRPPVEADKGTAVAALVGRAGVRRALYAGDDTTDVDAFAALDGLDLGVKVAVGSAEAPPALVAVADLVVEGTDGMLELLRKL